MSVDATLETSCTGRLIPSHLEGSYARGHTYVLLLNTDCTVDVVIPSRTYNSACQNASLVRRTPCHCGVATPLVLVPQLCFWWEKPRLAS